MVLKSVITIHTEKQFDTLVTLGTHLKEKLNCLVWMEDGTLPLPSVKVSVFKIKAWVDFGEKAGCFICNFLNCVTDFVNGWKVNYIPGNFEPFKEELALGRLFKLQLLNTLLSSFLVLVRYMKTTKAKKLTTLFMFV